MSNKIIVKDYFISYIYIFLSNNKIMSLNYFRVVILFYCLTSLFSK